MRKKILGTYKKIEDSLLFNKKLEMDISTHLSQIVSKAYTQSLQQSEKGFCFKFSLPIIAVLKLYNLLSLDKVAVKNSFAVDWGPGAASNYMHSDPYYQILLLLIYYGLKHKKPDITEKALFIFLMKIWNGRLSKYIKYCNPKIMTYVVSSMNQRFIVAKYDSPLFMIRDYFIPTLLKKYSSYILKDPAGKHGLKHLLEQSFTRMAQLFVQNTGLNPETGKVEKRGGLLPLYMKAKEEWQEISNPSFVTDEEKDKYEYYLSISDREVIINKIADYITTNPNIVYSKVVLNTIYKQVNVRKQLIDLISEKIHTYELHDQIYELILLMFERLDIQSKDDIKRSDLFSDVKKKIISSKNNVTVNKIRRLANYILNYIFEKAKIIYSGKPLKVEMYSQPFQGELRSVVYYILLFDIKKFISSNV